MSAVKYIGIPFVPCGRQWAGADCWGLVKLFYEAELGIILPEHIDDDYKSLEDREDLARRAEGEKAFWQKVNAPRFGDVILFRLFGYPSHIGIFLEKGRFLHTQAGIDSHISRLTDPRWEKRLEGFYRYGK